MPPCSARIGSKLWQTPWIKQIRPLRCGILCARCQELRRPRSESPLQSEIKNLYEIRTGKQFPRASCALAAPLLSAFADRSWAHRNCQEMLTNKLQADQKNTSKRLENGKISSRANLSRTSFEPQTGILISKRLENGKISSRANLSRTSFEPQTGILILQSSNNPRNSGAGSKTGSKFAFIPWRIWNVACSCHSWKIPNFITTLIPENSSKIVVKRDLRSTRQSCGHRL